MFIFIIYTIFYGFWGRLRGFFLIQHLTYAGTDKLSEQQKASGSCKGFWQALQHGSWKCQGDVDWGMVCLLEFYFPCTCYIF